VATRFAFVGFRHGHIFDLLKRVQDDPRCELVAACEENPATRAELEPSGKVKITHERCDRMLAEVQCDAIAVGDAYGLRGDRAIQALQAGKHVISDKPICTSLEQLKRIAQLAAKSKLCVGCQLDLRDNGPLRTARRLIQAGEIGEVQTVDFSGQHPLNLGVRPQWYFEPGMHGGTINDLAIHGIDVVSWIAGRTFAEVVAARAWNAKTPQFPHFQDAAQAMLRLDNDGGVLFDVSYLSPDGLYGLPYYWRFLIHGTRGVIETVIGSDKLMLVHHGEKSPTYVNADPGRPGGYLQSFLDEIAGHPEDAELTTPEVIATQAVVLTAQQAADQGKTNVPCTGV